jgi:(p)ppGpp synthase/HD superfamily hydrolase
MAEEHAVRVSDKFLRAAQWAADRHASYATSVPAVPSVAQVLGLASLVLEDGGTEREAIAAMLLDALGADVPRKELRAHFGKKVTALVVAAHPHRGTVAPGRVPVDVMEWRRRADAALDLAVTEDDPSALRIRAAAVLEEARALRRELRRNGTLAYVRCPAPPAEHLGHLRELATVLARRRPRTVITQELRSAVGDIERLSELEGATIAWRVTHVGAA